MKKAIKIISVIVIFIGIVWISLEPIVLRYLNNKINNIEGYRGSIEDVDIHLLTGKVRVQGLVLETVKDGFTRPFLLLPDTWAAIQWKSLFKGRLVAQLETDNPILNFEIEPSKDNNLNPDVNWVEVVQDIGVLDLNKLTINNGRISYLDRSSKEVVELNLEHINVKALNLSTVENKEKLLPSQISIDAISDGHGKFQIEANANLLKQLPDLDVEFSLKDLELSGYNDAFQEYAKLDVEAGTFELYSEFILKDSLLNGYVKPIIRNLQFFSFKEKQENIISGIWQGAAEILKRAVENDEEKQVASKIPIKGKITNLNKDILKSILSLLKNAFIEPLNREIEKTIGVKDILT
jgi:hypothetical protein